MEHLFIRLLNPKDNPGEMAPRTCLVQELAIFNRIIYLIECFGSRGRL